MNGLHQQIQIKRDALDDRRARLESGDLNPQDAADLEGVVARLERDIAETEASAIWGEEAFAKIETGFGLLDNIDRADRELKLAITAFETGLWRLRRHLGEPSSK
jgi:hypothetical protein